MAQMIPNQMPKFATKGEKALFGLLQNLPEDHICYYEPIIKNRYPDFIVIFPTGGIMVIEVKDWKLGSVSNADMNHIWVHYNASDERKEHPIRQARKYMLNLLNLCKEKHPELLDSRSRFRFPFGHLVVLTQVNGDQLDDNWKRIFPADRVVTKDILQSWHDLTPNELVIKLCSFFDPVWPAQMSELELIPFELSFIQNCNLKVGLDFPNCNIPRILTLRLLT